MNAVQQELFDLALLRVMDANRSRFGLNAEALGHLMAQFGFQSPDRELVLDRVDVLARKQLVEEVAKTIGAGNRAWRITPAGIGVVNDQ